MSPRTPRKRHRSSAATRQRPDGNIFIYCDDPSHPLRLPGTNFYPVGDGRWSEWYTSRAAQGARESGITLADDELLPPDFTENLSAYLGRDDVRSRYRVECRKCRDSAIPVREEKLFAVLNELAGDGVPEISLARFAAKLARIST